MPNRFFPSAGMGQNAGLALVRVLTGLFLVYHGWEIFDPAKMNDYGKWMTDLHFPAPLEMAYAGKGSELVGGILLVLGLFTRVGALLIIITMGAICFGMGKGRIFMEDQHPFLFVLLALVFFFIGPGTWSLDHGLFGKKRYT